MKRLAIFVTVLLAISQSFRAETRNDGFMFYVQLIQGTDTESPPAAGATLIGEALGQRLHMFKWKNYWELKRQTVHLNVGDKTRQRVTKNRDVEITLPTANDMTVCIYLDGKLTRKRTQRVNGAFYIAGGEKEEAQSWFIVIRHDKPQNAPATEAKSAFGDPNQRAFGQLFIERQEVIRRKMNAAVGIGPAQGRLVARSMDVNVARVRVDVAAAIKPLLQSFEPKNAMRNRSHWLAVPSEPDNLAAFKSNAHWPSATDLLSDAMKSARGFV